MVFTSPLENETVWELIHSGKNRRSVKKSKKASYSGRLVEPGNYVLVVETDEKTPNPIRYIKARFTLTEEGKPPVSIKRVASSSHEKVFYRFSIEGSADWNLDLSSPALVRGVKVSARINSSGDDYVPDNCIGEEIDVDKAMSEAERIIRDELRFENMTQKQQQKFIAAICKWPTRENCTRLNYNMDMAKEEMARDSKYKTRAFKAGIIRPFLFLVSMHPEDRMRWASALGINLIDKKYFGDSHREAWHMLTNDLDGIQARANHAYTESLWPLAKNSNWYLILQRVCRKSILRAEEVRTDEKLSEVRHAHRSRAKATKICKDMESQEMLALENMFSYALADVVDYHQEQHQANVWQQVHIQLMKDEKLMQPMVEKLRAAGYTDEDHMRLIAAQTLVGSNGVKGEVGSLQENLDRADDIRMARATARIALPMVWIAAQVIVHVVLASSVVFIPLMLIPVAMISVYTAGLIFIETPARLLLPLLGIILQKELLAYHDIRIEEYYPLMAQTYRNCSAKIDEEDSEEEGECEEEVQVFLSDDEQQQMHDDVQAIQALLRVQSQFPEEDSHKFKVLRKFFEDEAIEEVYDILAISDEEWAMLKTPPAIKQSLLSIASKC